MRMKKLILFDWGNVLLNSDFAPESEGYTAKKATLKSFERAEISKEAWDTLLYSDGLWTLQGDQLNNFLKTYVPPCNISTLYYSWYQNMKKVPWFEDNLKLIEKLQKDFSNTVDIGILSVCAELDYPLIQDRTGDLVRYNFFSYSMGLRKPDPRIYKNIQIMLNTYGDRILYFDDWAPSVEAAKNFGWNAVCLDGRDSTLIKKHIEEFLNIDIDERKTYGRLLIEEPIDSL